MVVEITYGTILIFLAFIIGVFVLYKVLKFILRASFVVVATFALPWVASYLGLPIQANLETALMFAFFGFSIFLVYEFFHFVVQFFRMLIWPFKKKK